MSGGGARRGVARVLPGVDERRERRADLSEPRARDEGGPREGARAGDVGPASDRVRAVSVAKCRERRHRARARRLERVRFVLRELLEERTGPVRVPLEHARERTVPERVAVVGAVGVLRDVGVERGGRLLPPPVEELKAADEEARLVSPLRPGVRLRDIAEGDDRFLVPVRAGEGARRAERVLRHVRSPGPRALPEHARGFAVLPAAVERVPFRAAPLERVHATAGGLLHFLDRVEGVVGPPGDGERFRPGEELVARERLQRRQLRERVVGVFPPRQIGRVDREPARVVRLRRVVRREPEPDRARLRLLGARALVHREDAVARGARARHRLRFLERLRGADERGGVRPREVPLRRGVERADEQLCFGPLAFDVVREERQGRVEPVERCDRALAVSAGERHVRARETDLRLRALGLGEGVEHRPRLVPAFVADRFGPGARARSGRRVGTAARRIDEATAGAGEGAGVVVARRAQGAHERDAARARRAASATRD